jgi:hypothetical protein
MLTTDYNYQYIDWSHDPVSGEPFNHLGNLITSIISPAITVGLTDYLNLSFRTSIGSRSMDWMGSSDSKHHRDESSTTDFDNAHGSLFGDSNLTLRYLFTNTGLKSGSRIFLGAGLSIPSNSVLTISPYLKDNSLENPYDDHRHFSLSDGCYKTNYEFQYYMKSDSKFSFVPSFYGFTINYLDPLNESEYGYLPGSTFTVITSLLFSTNLSHNVLPKGLSIGVAYAEMSVSSWHGIEANSSFSSILPTLGFIWSDDTLGSLSLNIKYNKNELIKEDQNLLNNKSKSIEISLGYRKTLDYTIPWLYW